MLIGNRLRKLRELRNYTQEYVAKALNMTATGYGKIERDESEVSFQKLRKIAEILDIQLEDILNFNENMVFNVKNRQGAAENEIPGANPGLVDSEKRLYEQIIEQLRQENTYLKTIIDRLQLK